jgi:hypothetical protein
MIIENFLMKDKFKMEQIISKLKDCYTRSAAAHSALNTHLPHDIYNHSYEIEEIFSNNNNKNICLKDESFENIDSLLIICRLLLYYELYSEHHFLVTNASVRFLQTYTNNGETSPYMFAKVLKKSLNTYNFLWKHVNNTNKTTWLCRYNQSVPPSHLPEKQDFPPNYWIDIDI